ncbi:hypothetical protein CCS01_14300 [Rhodopila globiformis]|uniref:Uncharacterized protein n=1 Tax=Rhodopila globiformis TaxID=1071 RepID=A0A2S6NFT4_RHOGL|nr:hypothetical protein CCS01_14300 [Rhodopila globiformis]
MAVILVQIQFRRKIVHNIATYERPTNVVTALFSTSVTSFSLAESATFADLADSVETISDHDTRVLMAIYLTVGVTDRPISALRSGV